jgi:hypothetical protein
VNEPSKLPTRDMSALLMAVIDGEADATDGARAFAAVAADPKLAADAEAFRLTGRSMGKLFDGILAEPVPGQLVHTVMTTEYAAKPARVRAARQQTGWLGLFDVWRLPAAVLAASALAFAAGGLFTSYLPQQPSTGSVAMLSNPALQRGLAEVSSGAEREVVSAQGSLKIKVVVSFRGRDGELCREYEAQGTVGARLFGVACMGANGWEAKATLFGGAKAAGTKMVTAGEELAAALDEITGRLKDGDVIGVDEERKLIAGGWRAAR